MKDWGFSHSWSQPQVAIGAFPCRLHFSALQVGWLLGQTMIWCLLHTWVPAFACNLKKKKERKKKEKCQAHLKLDLTVLAQWKERYWDIKGSKTISVLNVFLNVSILSVWYFCQSTAAWTSQTGRLSVFSPCACTATIYFLIITEIGLKLFPD